MNIKTYLKPPSQNKVLMVNPNNPPTIAPIFGVLFFSSPHQADYVDPSTRCAQRSARQSPAEVVKDIGIKQGGWKQLIYIFPQKCLEDGNIRGWILRSKFYNSSSSKSSALKNDAWKTILFFWNHPFLGGQVKLQRVMSVASSKNTLWFQNNSETTSCH